MPETQYSIKIKGGTRTHILQEMRAQETYDEAINRLLGELLEARVRLRRRARRNRGQQVGQ